MDYIVYVAVISAFGILPIALAFAYIFKHLRDLDFIMTNINSDKVSETQFEMEQLRRQEVERKVTALTDLIGVEFKTPDYLVKAEYKKSNATENKL